jgi:tetratricopeptide (TPR) repeat protein
LLLRQGVLAKYNDWPVIQKSATSLQQKIKDNAGDTKSILKLSAIYLQEARITGNYNYYDKAAMKLVSNVLQQDPGNFEAQTFKALIFLSQHHFADGLVVAQQLQQQYPYDAFVYGMLVDANIEMGNYDSAVAKAEKMISIRPDLRSYSRISYLREIHGDNNGAIEAMKMAVDAGSAGDEATEWCRIQLAKLYEHTGQVKYAAMHYTIALNERPGYPYALAGLARIAANEKDYNKAIDLYKKADSVMNDYTFEEELAEVYNAAGRKEDAGQIAQKVLDRMMNASAAMKNGDSSGHYADREIAYACLAVNDYDKALTHAMLEYGRRPDNIDVNETVAWVYYCKGDYASALPYIKTALKTDCKNPVLLCRAGLIFAKAGDKEKSALLLKEGLKDNPDLSPELKSVSEQIAQTL